MARSKPKYDIKWDSKKDQANKEIPKATISKASIRLNSVAAQLLNGNIEQVMLGVDVKQAVIAVRAHDGSETYKVYSTKTTQRPAGGLTISCKEFIREAQSKGIIPAETELPIACPTHFVDASDTETGTVYILLRDQGVEGN